MAPEVYYYELESVSEHLYTYGWVADYPDPENFLDLLLHSEADAFQVCQPALRRSVGAGAGGTGFASGGSVCTDRRSSCLWTTLASSRSTTSRST